MIKCRICGKENPKHIWYCEEHYRCEDCGTKEDLVVRNEGCLCDQCHKKRVKKRIAEFDGDTYYTDDVICPYCGYEFSDSWEMSEGEHDCYDCGNVFNMKRDVTVEYITKKK